MRRILTLICAALLAMLAACAIAEPYQNIALVDENRITYTLPKGMKLASVSTAPGELRLVIDTNQTHWDEVLMDAYDPSSGLIIANTGYTAPAGAVKGMNVNFSFDGFDEASMLELYKREAINHSPSERTAVGNGQEIARYDEDSTLLLPIARNGGEAILTRWYDENGAVITTELLVIYIEYTSLDPIFESLPKIPDSRLIAGLKRSSESDPLSSYAADVVSADVSTGYICYEIPDFSKLTDSRVYTAVFPPEDGATCRYRFAFPDSEYVDLEMLPAGTSLCGKTYQEPIALIPAVVLNKDVIDSISVNIEWRNAQDEVVEVARLTIQVIAGDPQPWPFYIDPNKWAPIPASRLNLSSLEAENISVTMKRDGWLHIAPVEGKLPDPQEIMDLSFEPLVTPPSSDAVWYSINNSGGSNIFGSNDVDMFKRDQEVIVNAADREEVNQNGVPMNSVPPIMEMPVNPDSGLIVYLSPELSGEFAGSVQPIFWYNEAGECIAKEFLVVTREPIVMIDERKVTSEEPNSLIELPVLVVPENSDRLDCTLVIERYPSLGDRSNYYELYLLDKHGQRIQPNGPCDLYLPYPNTQLDLNTLEFVIHHYDSSYNIVESFRGNEIDPTPYGLRIRVSHLSPFELTWDDGSSLPPSGDGDCKHELNYEGHEHELIERCSKCDHWSVLSIEMQDVFFIDEEITVYLNMPSGDWLGVDFEGQFPAVVFLDENKNPLDSMPSEPGEYFAMIEMPEARAMRRFEIVADQMPLPPEDGCDHSGLIYISEENQLSESCSSCGHHSILVLDIPDHFFTDEELFFDLVMLEGDWLSPDLSRHFPDVVFLDENKNPLDSMPSEPGGYFAMIEMPGARAMRHFVIETSPELPGSTTENVIEDLPQTGDTSLPLLWLALLALSTGALLLLRRRVKE